MRTTVVAVVKDAGSAGATTTTVTVATLLAQQGHTVLVVDLDAQANASHWLGVSDPCLSVTDVLLNQTAVHAAVVPSSVPLVSVLPATGDLKRARIELGRVMGPEQRLRKSLQPVAVDVILIDCQAGAGELLPLAAMIAADAVVTVTFPGPKELAGVPRVEGIVAEVADAYDRPLRLAAVIPCAVPSTNRGRLYGDALHLLRDSYGPLVTPAVRQSVVAVEALDRAIPLPVYAPGAPVVHDYRAVLAHLQATGVLP